tara:strand:+ start:21 stop:1451 length:1431 start_codon:yes stop_codon:yes gene_type:complete
MEVNLEILELLQSWREQLPDATPDMPLEDQAKFISKKYKTKECQIMVPKIVRNEETGQDEEQKVEETHTLVCFKDVIVKYRPHLHMGDYWLDVIISNRAPRYNFYSFIETGEGQEERYNAQHPHLSNGVPCLGNFQGDLATAFTALNFVQFFSIMKSYLQAYNGRSTYQRGTVYKKANLCCQLHSMEEIGEIFNDDRQKHEEDGSYFDYRGVAKDPMRWNWPKGISAWNEIEITGQKRTLLREYFSKRQYPGFSANMYSDGIYNFNSGHTNKILGYVYLAHILGEMPLFYAFEFVLVFLTKLRMDYEGDMSAEKLKALETIATKCSEYRSYRNFRVNSRYNIALPTEHAEELNKLWQETRAYETDRYSSSRGSSRAIRNFLENLKYAGHHFSNFMILLRKHAPQKALASTYLKKIKGEVDVPALERRYATIKKYAFNAALQQLDKDRRRFINELNKPEVSHIPDPNGQGTLFSENL